MPGDCAGGGDCVEWCLGGGGEVAAQGERVRPGSETGVWPWLHTGKYSCSEQGLLLAQTAERHSVQNLNCRRPCTL